MNTSAASTDERVREFNDGLHMLYDLTNSYRIQQVVEGSLRSTSGIVAAIRSLQHPKFSVEELEQVIELTGVEELNDSPVMKRLQAHRLACQLLLDYALVRGAEVHRRDPGEMPYIDWSHVPAIDTVTTV